MVDTVRNIQTLIVLLQTPVKQCEKRPCKQNSRLHGIASRPFG